MIRLSGSRWRRLGWIFWMPLACGHFVPPELAPGHAGGFDFKAPPCAPASRMSDPGAGPSVDAVDVRYLGTAGLYLEWQGVGVLTGPFFSRPTLGRVLFGHVRPRPDVVAQELAAVPVERVRAILVGHAHYDHLEDLPVVLREHTRRARLFANASAKRLLFADPDVYRRTIDVERWVGRWHRLIGDDGTPLPMRLMPLATSHAPQAGVVHYAPGEVPAPVARPWHELRHEALRQGQPLAFLLDLLDPVDPDRVRFRLYYQDAASREGTGLPPPSVAEDGHGVDLAVLCMPSHHLAPGFPTYLLDALEPRHVLATHYDDFFRPLTRPIRFAPLLTNGRAASFLRQVAAAPMPPSGFSPPEGPVCGPSTEVYTMPLPREWLRFDIPTSGDEKRR